MAVTNSCNQTITQYNVQTGAAYGVLVVDMCYMTINLTTAR